MYIISLKIVMYTVNSHVYNFTKYKLAIDIIIKLIQNRFSKFET